MIGLETFNPMEFIMKSPDVSELIEKQIKTSYKKHSPKDAFMNSIKEETYDKSTASKADTKFDNGSTSLVEVDDSATSLVENESTSLIEQINDVAHILESARKHGITDKVYQVNDDEYNSALNKEKKAKEKDMFGGIKDITKTLEDEYSLYLSKSGVSFRIYV